MNEMYDETSSFLYIQDQLGGYVSFTRCVVNILLPLISMFCYDKLPFHEFHFISMDKTTLVPKSTFTFTFTYPFIYTIWRKWKCQKQIKGETFSLNFYTKMKNLRIS